MSYTLDLVPRWLHILLVVCALATTSGLPTVVSAAAALDACADDCGEDEPGPRCPDDPGNGCAPFCHGCLCRAGFATTAPPANVRAVVDDPQLLTIPLSLPASQTPPPRGVFHPPRLSA